MRSKNKRPRLRRVVPVSRRQRWMPAVLATDEDYESLVRTAAAARAALAELVPPDEPYPISRHPRWQDPDCTSTTPQELPDTKR